MARVCLPSQRVGNRDDVHARSLWRFPNQELTSLYGSLVYLHTIVATTEDLSISTRTFKAALHMYLQIFQAIGIFLGKNEISYTLVSLFQAFANLLPALYRCKHHTTEEITENDTHMCSGHTSASGITRRAARQRQRKNRMIDSR